MKTYVAVVLEQTINAINVDDEDNEVVSLKTNKAYSNCLFVSPQIDEIITLLEIEKGCRADFLDIECLDKEVRQSLTFVDTSKWVWSLSEMVKYYLNREITWDEEHLKDILVALKECFLAMKSKGKDEWSRIEQIELPVNRLLYKSQRRGFYVDKEAIKEECEKCFSEKYHLKNRIQLELGQVVPNIHQYMLTIGIPEWKINRYSKKIFAKDHQELKLYNDLEKAERDFSYLMYMSSYRQDDKCKPIYKGFGTSTGRITMRDPALQNLNRKYRSFIKEPDVEENGWKYIYVDYSQFEAGILAGFTKNKKLIKLYKDEQIYDKLGKIVGVDRDMAKTYFYCFVYGGIVCKGAEKFFEEYCSKSALDSIVEKAKTKGKIASLLGNNRILELDGENKWVVNHLIQSTSSLIFKKALLNVESINADNIHLIMPMHDAALYLVKEDVDENVVKRLFVEAFKEYLPDITPIVKLKDYFGGE